MRYCFDCLSDLPLALQIPLPPRAMELLRTATLRWRVGQKDLVGGLLLQMRFQRGGDQINGHTTNPSSRQKVAEYNANSGGGPSHSHRRDKSCPWMSVAAASMQAVGTW